MKLKVKLIAFLVSLTLLTGGLIIWLSNVAVHMILIEEVAHRGYLKADDLLAPSISGFRDGKEVPLLLLLQVSEQRTGAVYAMALDPNGLVMAHTNVVEKGKHYTDPVTLKALKSDQPGYQEVKREGQSILEIWLPVWAVREAGSGEEFLLFGGKELKETTRLGTLRLGLPIQNVLETVDRISNQMIWIMMASGGVMLGVSLFFMGGILKRIRVLVEGTHRISRGDYGSSVPVLSKDELGELARSFNQMSQELSLSHQDLENQVKTRTQEIESFVYTVSHDLKSPVVSMQGMASIFLEDYGNKVDEKGRYYLERILTNADFMERLIQDLLTLSRVGREQQNPEMVEVGKVLQEVVDIHQADFKQKGIEVVIQPGFPHFVFDQGQLTQLFHNLVTNAAKFIGDQPRPRIEVGGRQTKEYVEFYVRDNGIGIDPEYHEKIFGLFQRLKEVEVEGTGVGLAVVKKIMDSVGGKVWVESQKKEGAVFFLRFPRK